ncbi:MAG: hypothetical protein ACI8O8_001869 [Oleiphilaceae bacterium]|jgi:hypothetical protein
MHPSVSQAEWREVVSRVVKSEMSKRKLKYEDLSQMLKKKGTIQTSSNLRNKINRGIMGAELFIQILIALDLKQLDINSIRDISDSLSK